MTRILAVDDERINLAIISECLSDEGYEIDQALDGEAAWEKIQEQQYDLILLDRMMPRLDGLSLLKRIKADPKWQHLHVIMQTAASRPEDIQEGLEAGAHYYLTKPYESEALLTLIRTVVLDLQDQRRQLAANPASDANGQASLTLLQQGEFNFKTLDEARNLAASLSQLCEDGDNANLGLAELLINAIEHGNLGITYAEKSHLRETFGWEEEVQRRLSIEPYANRRAVITIRQDQDQIEFTITDQGAGFNWKPYLHFDPDRAFDLNGRGIAMAKMMGFLSLAYQGDGNVVVARAKAKQLTQ